MSGSQDEFVTPREKMWGMTDDITDRWIAQGAADGGLGGVKLRTTADHEAVHAAAAISLGWTVTDLRVDSVDRGETGFSPPAGRRHDRLQRDELAILIAPIVCGHQQASGGDGPAAMLLAETIAGNGDPLRATSREVSKVLDQARREVHALAERRDFQHIRHILRDSVAHFGSLDRGDVAHLTAQWTPSRPKAKAVKAVKAVKAASTPKATVLTAAAAKRRIAAKRKQTVTATSKPKPIKPAADGCRGCGASFTPPHRSGKCFICRTGPGA